MSAKQKRFSYNVAFKLNVITFVKQHVKRAAERHFCPTSNGENDTRLAKTIGRITEAIK
jgi:hypothetical protein